MSVDVHHLIFPFPVFKLLILVLVFFSDITEGDGLHQLPFTHNYLTKTNTIPILLQDTCQFILVAVTQTVRTEAEASEWVATFVFQQKRFISCRILRTGQDSYVENFTSNRMCAVSCQSVTHVRHTRIRT